MKQLKLKELYDIKKLPGKCPCFICKTESSCTLDEESSSQIYICPRCGYLEITYHFREYYRDPLEGDIGFTISSYIRRMQERRQTISDPYRISLDFDAIKKEAIKSKPTFSKKLFLLLEAIENIQSYLGEEIYIEDEWIEYYLMAMSYAKNSEEFKKCIDFLIELQYISRPPTVYEGPYPSLKITSKGYEFLEKYRKERKISEITDVFVAMEFKDSEDICRAIEEAVCKAKYNPRRADKDHYTEYVMDWIKAKIRESRFVIADISTGNLGVYFEIGYALGLEIPVITILKQEDDEEDPFKKVHFDLKQFNTLVYKTSEELKERLYYRIVSLFGKGPEE